MQWILDNLELVTSCVCVLLGVIAFVVTFIRTGNIKKSIRDFKEVKDMAKDERKYAQTFSETKKDYILNPATNELEELPLPKNIQDKIQSYIDTCLDSALEKFLPKVEEVDEYADYTQRIDDLAALGEYMELAEDYRERLGLGDKASVADIYAAVDKSAKELKARLQAKPDDKKEVFDEQKSS